MTQRTLIDELIDGPPEPKPVIEIQRSDLELYLRCPLQYRLLKEHGDEDHDANRPREVGIEFHRIMAEYISHLLASQQTRDPDELIRMAIGGNPRFQPELVHCAHLTAPRVGVWATQYINHEEKYAYVLPNFGPHGEDVALSCELDLCMYGDGPGEVRITDWKTGYGKTGFDFQAMFYVTVLAHSREGVDVATWQPFFCRFGTWGKREEFDAEKLHESEGIIKQAAMDFLSEEDWLPTPGAERCKWCAHWEECPVGHDAMGVEDDPVGYANATAMLKLELAKRMANMKAHVIATGEPIQTDDGWYGVNVLSQRPQFGLNKGTPGYIGQDDDPDGSATNEA